MAFFRVSTMSARSGPAPTSTDSIELPVPAFAIAKPSAPAVAAIEGEPFTGPSIVMVTMLVPGTNSSLLGAGCAKA